MRRCTTPLWTPKLQQLQMQGMKTLSTFKRKQSDVPTRSETNLQITQLKEWIIQKITCNRWSTYTYKLRFKTEIAPDVVVERYKPCLKVVLYLSPEENCPRLQEWRQIRAGKGFNNKQMSNELTNQGSALLIQEFYKENTVIWMIDVQQPRMRAQVIHNQFYLLLPGGSHHTRKCRTTPTGKCPANAWDYLKGSAVEHSVKCGKVLYWMCVILKAGLLQLLKC